MVVLRQARVIGEHARIRQFEMHPVEVRIGRDDIGARMLHIRRAAGAGWRRPRSSPARDPGAG